MRIIYILFSLYLLPIGLFAQEKWDLEKCIIYAVENSIDVQRSDLILKDADVVKLIRERSKLPSLNGTVSAFSNFGRTIDPTSNEFITSNFVSNSFGINTNMNIYNGGRINNSIKRSEIDKKTFMADKNSTIASVTLNIVTAYFEALLAGDNFSNAEIQVKTITDQINQMQKLVSAGSRAQFEIYDLEAQLASSEQQLTLAQNRIDLSMLNLKGLMNLDPNTEMTLEVPPLDQTTYTDLDNVGFEDIYNRVVGTRPEFEALNYRITGGEVDIDIAKADLLPSIGIGGSLSTNYSNQAKDVLGFVPTVTEQSVFIDGNPATLGVPGFDITGTRQTPYFNQLDNNFSYGIGVQMNIPIYSNYSAKGNIERAKINLENLRADKQKYEIDLRNILGQYLTDAKAAKLNLQAADKVLAARKIAAENAEKRYNLGAINSFDYISIQDQLNTARTDQLLAKYDYMMKIKVLDFYQGYPVTLK